MRKFFVRNGLATVFLLLFFGALAAQVFFGMQEYNTDLAEDGGQAVTLGKYLVSGHFIESTFENWESEFLQMGLFVWFTIFLRQKGSSESKSFDGEEGVDREPSPARKGAPWPVRKGGVALKLYENSLTIVLMALFVTSFILHFYGSLSDDNLHKSLKGEAVQDAFGYACSPKFWFESFQNWQSEFLSVFAIIVLSIFLRQKGSSQSKPVDAPNSETGD